MNTPDSPLQLRAIAVAVLTAVLLSGCGGSGDPSADSAQAAAPVSAKPGEPNVPPDSAADEIRITGLAQQAEPNERYIVDAAVPGTVVITLPADARPGDKLSISGLGTNTWQIAQNPGQTIATTGLPGDKAPGEEWTAISAADGWWAVGSSADASLIVGLANHGDLLLSSDAGASWSTPVGLPAHWDAIAITPDGRTLLASAWGGQLWVSQDAGKSWHAAEQAREWASVAVSTDGQRMAATTKAGRIHVSSDGGASWTPQAQDRAWRGIASSADGMRLVAVVKGGQIWTSQDAGLTWTARESARNWTLVTSSADGLRLAASDSGGYVYVSSDGGQSWQPRFREGPVTSLASSADGLRLSLTRPAETNIDQALVYTSQDGGLTWSGSADNRYWTGVAQADDGQVLIAAELDGKLWLTRGHRTTAGTTGGLVGGQGDSLQLEYLGDGRFRVLQYSAGRGLEIR